MHSNLIAAAGLCCLPIAAAAQEPAFAVAGFGGAHLVVGLVAGVLLAIAFELVLTNLSVAGGITALGARRDRGDQPQPSGAAGGDAERTPVPRRVVSGIGLWMLVSTSIALFAASWLAVEISGVANAFSGVIIGLVVWAAFLLLMVYWEALAVSSLLGSAFRAATGGLRTVAGATRSLFGGAGSATAHAAAAAARQELFDEKDPHDLRKWLESMVERMRTPNLDYKRIRKEVERVLEDTGVAQHAREGQPVGLADVYPDPEQPAAGAQAEQGSRLKRVVDEVLSALQAPSPGAAAGQLSRWITGSTGDFKAGMEQYLRNAQRDELDPEAIKRELTLLAKDPRAGAHALAERLRHVDRDAIVALLKQRPDLDEEHANRIVDNCLGARDALLGGAGKARGSAHERVGAARERLRGYFGGLQRDELSYDDIVNEFQLLLRDPRSGWQAMRDRLARMDRETIKAVLGSRANTSPEDAERMVARIEKARDEAISRWERTRDQVTGKAHQAMDGLRSGAEETRRTAATAAWWMVGASVASGICAAVAGAIAVNV